MTNVADRMLGALWHLLFGPIGRLLPFRMSRAIAAPLGTLLWAFGVRRAVVLRNLELAFPALTPADRRRIGRASTINLVTVYLETIALRHLSDRGLERAITVENIGLLRSIGEEGAILLSGHFGNWELLAYGAAALAGMPFAIIVKDQQDYGELERTRTHRGNSVIPTARAAREASTLLKQGGVLAMLADQSAPEGDVLTEMFGIPTYTYGAPARLALRYRPRVIAGYAVRTEAGTYHVRLREISHHDLPDSPEGVQGLAQRYVADLEETIRAHPEQWVWHHRKWKNSPGVRYE